MEIEQALQDFGEFVIGALPREAMRMEIEGGELCLLAHREHIVKTLSFLRDDVNCQFKQLMDICGVDYPGREERFDVVYNLLSLTHNRRIRVKIRAAEDSMAPTVTSVFKSANWYEREVFDMFGVYFAGHPDLRRILTDYGFEGHPLRKDFPLSGYVEVRYDDERKQVAYEPVKLAQAYRSFDFQSPWEGAEYAPAASKKA